MLTRRLHVVLLAVAGIAVAACSSAPNPNSCIPQPGKCGADMVCDMTTGKCVHRDAGSGDGLTGDGGSDGDHPADDGAKEVPPDAALLANGATCTSGTVCTSGHCADGVCCDTACTGACTACALPTSKGTCSPVKSADDPDSCPVAMMKTCNAAGACRAKNGVTCTAATDCLSGFCADGLCCDTACTGSCSSCALATSKGTCSPVKNADDPDSCTAATSTCDASGTCKFKNGAACGGGADCLSGSCADGVCCNTGCTGSCLSCAVSGSAGTCTAIKGAEDLDTCSGTYTCSATGACRLKDMQGCSTSDNCASGTCTAFYRDVDGDGHGDPLMSARFCTSAPTAMPPWVTSGDDCCDKDPLVYPGQTAYQFQASAACGDSFDYDCSGAADREYPYSVSCAGDGAGMCDPTAHDGWTGPIPICGKVGTLATCGVGLCGPISCCTQVSSTTGMTQRCR